MSLTYNRKLEIAAGLSFIIATMCYASGSGMVTGALTGTSFDPSILSLGVMLEIGNSLAVMVLGILFFERFRDENKTVLMGYVLSRAVEAVLLMGGSVIVLFAVKSNSPQNLQALLIVHDAFFSSAMLVLGLYSAFFFAYLFKRSIGPKWLMALGVLGYVMASIYALITLVSGFETNPLVLFAPGGIFEILLPLWMLFKGLD